MTKGALEDKYAFNEFDKLIKKFNIKRIVETGTYLGWSCKKLSEFNIKIDSIEVNESYYIEAKKLVGEIDNVNLHLGSSPEILDRIIKENEENLLFFFDAHWHNYWPILDELNIIYKKKLKPVIIIHDFFVPDEENNAKFGFDSFNNIKLDINLIKNHLDLIYNQNFNYHYSDKIDSVNSGLIYIYP